MRRLVLVFIIAIFTISCKNELTIVSSNSKSTQEDLAAKEVCRYIYQRTGELVPIVTLTGNDLPLDAIIIATRGTSFYRNMPG